MARKLAPDAVARQARRRRLRLILHVAQLPAYWEIFIISLPLQASRAQSQLAPKATATEARSLRMSQEMVGSEAAQAGRFVWVLW